MEIGQFWKAPLKMKKEFKKKTTLRQELERINLKASSLQTKNKHIAQSEARLSLTQLNNLQEKRLYYLFQSLHLIFHHSYLYKNHVLRKVCQLETLNHSNIK